MQHIRARSLWLLLVAAPMLARAADSIRATAAPAGPYRVQASHILDSAGREYLIRGTSLAAVSLNQSDLTGAGDSFGALSNTTLASIRHRLNMNAVRLPVDASEFSRNPAYRDIVKTVVRNARLFDLLVILTADLTGNPSSDALLSFWGDAAGVFRDNPNLFFAPSTGLPAEKVGAAVRAIRGADANQPIVVPLSSEGSSGGIDNTNLIYEAAPHYAATRTDADRRAQFDSLSDRVPVLVNGLDPEIAEGGEECRSFPGDPGEASRLIEDTLTYFDERRISWTISSFTPGKLISEYHFYNGSKLDFGWTCGKPPGMAGIGLALLSHLWNSDPHGLFAVHSNTGSFYIPRGGMVTAYGPTMAEKDLDAGPEPLPTKLGNVSVRITDSRGVSTLAPLLHTGAGWSYLSFVMPETAATGPATVEVVRTDGSSSAGKVIIVNVAPGLATAEMNGRGAVSARVVQRLANGQTKELPVAECANGICRAVPIPLARRVLSTLRLEAVGVRHAGPRTPIHVLIGDREVPVISSAPMQGSPGRDEILVRLPDSLIGYGERDITLRVNGLISNVARIHCGSAR